MCGMDKTQCEIIKNITNEYIYHIYECAYYLR